MTEPMKANAGPECVACRGGRDDPNHSCVYCQGQGRVQSLDQWVAAGKPKTPHARMRAALELIAKDSDEDWTVAVAEAALAGKAQD